MKKEKAKMSQISHLHGEIKKNIIS